MEFQIRSADAIVEGAPCRYAHPGMDSVSQFVLGGAVAAAVLGAEVRPWRAVLIGGGLGTLPDLDVLIDHGEPIANMTMHRAESHALLWLTLATPLLTWLVRRAAPGIGWGRWSLAVWLVLATHVGLDWLTIYGTQVWLPFTDRAWGLGCLFVVDPLYTLPLLLGLAGLLLARRRGGGWNHAGLAVSTAYVLWSAMAQQHVLGLAGRELERLGVVAERLVATPAPLQTVLWRVVAVAGDEWYEAHWSFADAARPWAFVRRPRGRALEAELRDVPGVARLVRFSHGCVRLAEDAEGVRIADLRMGQEPYLAFEFRVARRNGDGVLVPLPQPEVARRRPPLGDGLRWLWRRMWGEPVEPPR